MHIDFRGTILFRILIMLELELITEIRETIALLSKFQFPKDLFNSKKYLTKLKNLERLLKEYEKKRFEK